MRIYCHLLKASALCSLHCVQENGPTHTHSHTLVGPQLVNIWTFGKEKVSPIYSPLQLSVVAEDIKPNSLTHYVEGV